MRTLAWLCLLAAIIASAAFIIGTTPQLPARVSSHFAGDGHASGWMTRDDYLALTLALAVVVPLVVAALLSFMPRLVKRGLNIPHRGYWLAGDRRAKTVATLGVFACWLGCMLTLFFSAIHYTIIKANATLPAQLPALFFIVMGCFFAAMLLWAAALHARFRTPH
jgi:uncharacterized membrane protein